MQMERVLLVVRPHLALEQSDILAVAGGLLLILVPVVVAPPLLI
jgi:hypothetical protein